MSTAFSFFIPFLFYIGWFGSISLANSAFNNWAVLFPLLMAGVLILKRELSYPVALTAFSISLVGVLFDSIMATLKLVAVAGQTSFLVPLWLISIWLLFSFSLVPLRKIFEIPAWLAALFGFAMGPLSYKSGELFEVFQFVEPTAFWIYALFWALAFPISLKLFKRFS
jgi:hypothetical protein